MLSGYGKLAVEQQSLRTDAVLGPEQIGTLDAFLRGRRKVALPAALHLTHVPVIAAAGLWSWEKYKELIRTS